MQDTSENELEQQLEGYEKGVLNIINYLLSVHNALKTIVVGTHPENDKILIIPEETYLQVLDSLNKTASELAESLGLVVENIEDVVVEESDE